MSELNIIDYKKIFYYFEQISKVPRGSGNNKGISNYLVKFAKEHNLKYIQDEYFNVIIYKDASTGFEHKPGVILQAHMDMVCEKESDIIHDFKKDSLKLYIKDGFVHAKGTTLGGDDGIGVAYILALLDDDKATHPAIEALITTDEEVGMDGSIGLDASVLSGKYLLNIDSEEEGIFLSSCAGGATVECTMPLSEEEIFGKKVKIIVKGLRSGHSGTDINSNRQNASLILCRILNEIRKDNSYNIVSMYGGTKDNVIPSEAKVELVIQESDMEKVCEIFSNVYNSIKQEIMISEPYFEAELIVSDEEPQLYLAYSKKTVDNILNILMSVPNGVLAMSSAIEGLVESSVNLGIIKLDKDGIMVKHSVRSSINNYKKYVIDRFASLYRMVNGNVNVVSEYPAWEYKNESHLRDVFCETYLKMFDKKAEVEAIHAGLECGILANKIEGLDIVSFGPDIFDIHTVNERMDIESAKRCYDLMIEVLKNI